MGSFFKFKSNTNYDSVAPLLYLSNKPSIYAALDVFKKIKEENPEKEVYFINPSFIKDLKEVNMRKVDFPKDFHLITSINTVKRLFLDSGDDKRIYVFPHHQLKLFPYFINLKIGIIFCVEVGQILTFTDVLSAAVPIYNGALYQRCTLTAYK